MKGGIVATGALVRIPLAGLRSWGLDGFWVRGARLQPRLLVLVHGMGGNFHGSGLARELMSRCRRLRFDFLSFDNRGVNARVADERFADCLADVGAVVRWAGRMGYRRIALAGHSTGCQKIVYFQSLRPSPRVGAIVLAAPADDYAIARRDLGARFGRWVRRARTLADGGRAAELLPKCCYRFSARRFLSIADPARPEAALFDYGGRLRHFRRIRVPTLTVFGRREEYACIPVRRMGAILAAASRARAFRFAEVPAADHAFHGRECATARLILRWLDGAMPIRRADPPATRRRSSP